MVTELLIGGVGWIVWPWMVHAKPQVTGLLMQFGSWALGYLGLQGVEVALSGGYHHRSYSREGRR